MFSNFFKARSSLLFLFIKETMIGILDNANNSGMTLKKGKSVSDPMIQGHFIGSIVYIESGLYQISSVPQLLVIDGQQRLTTLSLLLASLSKALEGTNVEDEITPLKINNYYLFNSMEKHELRYKIRLRERDKETFLSIVENQEYPTLFLSILSKTTSFLKNKYLIQELIGQAH